LNAPLLILIGEVDDWTPADRCMEMMPQEENRHEVILKVYPKAFHGFDILGANKNVSGSKGTHHIQYQPEAEEDSIIRVRNFLENYLK
jgi:dienelactone hydrolase